MFHRTMKSALLSATIVAGMAGAASAATYMRGNDGNPETLDQHKTSTVAEANILRDLYEGLVVYTPSAEVAPGVAEEWEVSDDGLTYTFKLREDAMWSNGDPVTAQDFVYSLQRIMKPETGAKYANILYPIENAEAVNKGEAEPESMGVTAVDDKTLEIKLGQPTPFFIELLTHQTGLPVHPASVEEHGADFVQPGKMVSNGAFVLDANILNDKIVLKKNENFHGADDVALDMVNYLPFEDRATCVRAWEAGEVHSCSDLPAEDIARLKDEHGDAVRVAPYLGTYYYALNHEDEFLADPEVRQALSMAIDRVFLAEEIFQGTMVPAESFVPPGIGNYSGGSPEIEYFGMSMLDREDKAAEILEAKGVSPDSPVTIELMYNTSENHKNAATAIADMWSNLGVNVEFNVRDASAHYAHLRDRGDFDVARAGWIGDYSDPQNFLFMVESDNDGFNYARYDNAEYDQLMDEAAAETDLEKRSEILKKAEALFMRDLPFIPLLYYSSRSLVSPNLSGWEDNIQNVHASRYLSLSE
ncbi:oligopeptide transport system substrate-binding protein [Cribrihabitans marinus]|uniref:Oligopeptide transport system substrate-binding protein n=1 Tax=Cribrihabitans marinus TaxID=1227549 RepID=A0A1H7D7E4_9RHOB|nr:peptide ABC transporter substrate-binding protein [Cribrihabitans marinus]GGH37205.1 ABC transporter substrate-binding protein [Cribrihabitans marinus]SEJ95080.1 oligopeptide transport system substrate-binding protein [Cribrihabitans marinus]